MHNSTTPDSRTPAEVWEERYSSREQMWSGRVNVSMATVAADLPPGRSVDLGCGEGGDVVWLAEQGWDATGLDLSPTAVARARAAAQERGLNNAHFAARDLTDLALDTAYDLVTASFFHSMVELARTEILRAAARGVVPGGHLLIVSHGAAPPWADAQAHEHTFPSPEEELADLNLDPAAWQTVICEARRRPATGPDGESAHLDDVVVLVRRTA